MKIPGLDAAAAGNASLRNVLARIEQWTEEMERGTGFVPFGPGTVGQDKAAPPPLASFIVTGANGSFVVEITTPDDARGTMFHEVKSSQSIPFSNSTTILQHGGPSPSGHIVIVLPSETRYFQLRSRYGSSVFNQPQVSAAIASGV